MDAQQHYVLKADIPSPSGAFSDSPEVHTHDCAANILAAVCRVCEIM